MTFNKGLQLTIASRGALIMSLMPMLSLLLGAVFKVEKLNIYKAMGCFITIIGVALGVSSGLAQSVSSSSVIIGDMFMFAVIVQGALFSVFQGGTSKNMALGLCQSYRLQLGFLCQV